MNGRLLLASGVGLWAGTTLLLSQLRWFRRVSLVDRLRPYAPGGMAVASRGGVLSVGSFRDAVGPLARTIGERVAGAAGIAEDLDVRLARVHSPLDVTAFRVRQVGHAVAGLGVAALASVALALPATVALAFLLGAPVLAFLVEEQRLAIESSRWQERVFRELPVVAEQLALLLAAGWSMTAALNRLAARGDGAVAADLQRVCRRIRHGVAEADALRSWAAVAKVDALDRLVSVLALNRDAGDLGRLISEEARAIRRDAHRRLIEQVERRNQQVWIPVTVATLVPGVLFLAIPFVEALRLFSR